MSTLSDRYVWGVMRSIPERQRADLEPEIRALVADAVPRTVSIAVSPEGFLMVEIDARLTPAFEASTDLEHWEPALLASEAASEEGRSRYRLLNDQTARFLRLKP